jgi:hypothetical protein
MMRPRRPVDEESYLMKAMMSIFRAGAVAAYLALSAAGLALLSMPGESMAQSQGGWRKELADKAAAAQTAGQKGNYSGRFAC